MTYKEIESFKSLIMQSMQKGCSIKSDAYGINGRIIGVGFKPFWANPGDSKIDKLEFNFMDRFGRIVPFYLHNIIGYEITGKDEERLEDSKKITMSLYIFSPRKSRDAEHYDKVSLEIRNL